MRIGAFVTFEQVNRAALAVQGELERLGLWHEDSRLRATDVIWCRLPQLVQPDALGFCYDSTPPAALRWLGYQAGNIYIPQWVLSQWPWQQHRGSLRAIIRHEYAHALAWHYPALIRRSPPFATAFGGHYDDPEPVAGPATSFVSSYARTRPAEDFAETFMWFAQCAGRRPGWVRHRALRRKWAWLRAVVRVVAAGGARWEELV